MQHAALPSVASAWCKRENLVAGIVLLIVAALAWVYTLWPGSMQAMDMPSNAPATAAMKAAHPTALIGQLSAFLVGWTVMMIAMMLPVIIPLLLLYRATARRKASSLIAAIGVAALIAGYAVVWTIAGLPVFAYNEFAGAWGPGKAVLPALLLIFAGGYQFTTLKSNCHDRCSNPLFFLAQHWRPGITGAARLGALHGLDCLGCCAGLMTALVALGMMNLAWMLSATVIIFIEKTLPGSHRLAKPLGVAMLAGGSLLLAPVLQA